MGSQGCQSFPAPAGCVSMAFSLPSVYSLLVLQQPVGGLDSAQGHKCPEKEFLAHVSGHSLSR